jgi:signal transduction histidine kinase
VTKSGSPAAVLDFAVGQILRDDTALGALPAVLDRLVSVFGLRAALAFQPAAVLAMHPPGSVDDQLLARIVRLTMAHRDTSAGPLTVTLGGQPASVLLVHSAPVAGRCRFALALIGDVAGWDDEVRATAHAVAAMVATQIRHANDMTALAERQTLTRALIAGAPVSHELRTPLTSIVSFTELIRGEAEGLTPDGIRFLDIIERNADRLHRLVGDLLMLDRLEAGALPLDLAPVSVPDLVLEAVRSASAGAAKQGIAIELRAGTGPGIQGDQRRPMQILDNLITNAVKFSHRNQQVRVTADHDGRQWRIDISDRGIGIPEAEAGRLFNRFVRASNARSAGLPGTGLGLSIVKVLTEMHGGHVEVKSTLGQGSTFSVYLPGAS